MRMDTEPSSPDDKDIVMIRQRSDHRHDSVVEVLFVGFEESAMVLDTDEAQIQQMLLLYTVSSDCC